MYCNQCGKEIPSSAGYCTLCGTKTNVPVKSFDPDAELKMLMLKNQRAKRQRNIALGVIMMVVGLLVLLSGVLFFL